MATIVPKVVVVEPVEKAPSQVISDILNELGYEALQQKFLDADVDLETWISTDKLLVDKWLTDLGIAKIGSRIKFIKLLKAHFDSIEAAKIESVRQDDRKIYLKEYDKNVSIRPPSAWPLPAQYKAMIQSSEPEEAIEDIKATNGTIGVVVSLLLTMVFLQNGKDVTPSPNSMWKSNIDKGQDLLTILLAMSAVVCVCVILFTTRLYCALSMLPNNAGRLTMCMLGGDFTYSYANTAFLLFAILFGVTIIVWESLVFDRLTGTIIMAVTGGMIILQLLMCGYNGFWPGGTVDNRFENILHLLNPEAKTSMDVAMENVDYVLSLIGCSKNFRAMFVPK